MFEREPWYKELPNEELEIDSYNLHLFFSTMYERQMIWKRRFVNKDERPWTKNKIFNTYKFTNVYRELDRSSQWQIKNIILDESLSLKNLVWKVLFYRIFNNPDTFSFDPKKYKQTSFFKDNELIPSSRWKNGIPDWKDYDEEEFSSFIRGIRSCGVKPFTDAYVINALAGNGRGRDYCYTRVVLPILHKKIDDIIRVVKGSSDPKNIIKYLKTIPEVSDFTAHEFYQDFTYISKYTNHEFMKFTQNDFTNVGPGASLGIRLIYPSLSKGEQKEGIYRLQKQASSWLYKISKNNNELFPFLYWDKNKKEYYVDYKCNISLHQIEMWLCEFSKYWKMMIGEGKSRKYFIPKTIVK